MVFMDTDVERALIERAQSGDRLAYQNLFKIYRPRIYRLVDQLLRNTADADDVVQDIFLKLFSALDSYRHQSSFFTWVYRIATNAARARLNARTRNAYLLVDGGSEAIEQSYSSEYDQPEIAHGRAELASALDAAIAGLPSAWREAFLLREIDGLSYGEIAELTKCPIGTVKSRISRAKSFLADHISLQDFGMTIGESSPGNRQESGARSNRN